MTYWWLVILLIGTMLVGATVADAQWERPQKKLVEYGWDVPYPDYVRANVREMEKRPFDGIIFRLRDYNHAFDTRLWQETDLADQVEDLRNIEWGSFTDNFLCLYAANSWKMDWFDDAQWSNIVSNLRLTAQAALAGGCVGICFDYEPYGDNPWAYRKEQGSFPAVAAQVRERGGQFMQAIQQEWPNVRFLTLFQLSGLGRAIDEPDPVRQQQVLAENGYGLLPAFVNGLLDAAGPQVRIIDGNEGAYYYTDTDSYFRAYHLMKQRALALVAPENRDKYLALVQAGSALYMDQVLALRLPAGAFVSYYMSPEERARFFEHNVYYALATADEYVWCYSERMNWWQGENVPLGAEEATRSARDKIAEGKPLGFDIADIIAEAQARWDAVIVSRLVRRTAVIRPLGPGEAAPEIDGALNDDVWQDREPLEAFLPQASQLAERPEAETRAWAAFDAQRLYIAFRCQEPHTGRLVAAGETRDDALWRGDTVEIFLSLGEAPLPYRHFIIGPTNLQFDEHVTAETDDHGWDAEWLSGTRVGDKEWTVEVAIPWEALGGRPRPGESRRVNLCRDREPVSERSAWSSVVHGFLEPENFGVWVFAE